MISHKLFSIQDIFNISNFLNILIHLKHKLMTTWSIGKQSKELTYSFDEELWLKGGIRSFKF